MSFAPEILLISGALATVVVLVLAFELALRRVVSSGDTVPSAPSSSRPAMPVTLSQGLGKTRAGLLARLQSAWGSNQDLAHRLAELEEVLLASDIGVKATQQLLERLRSRGRELDDGTALRHALRTEMTAILGDGMAVDPTNKPLVVLVAGVNGVGKTTTIGKLAHRYVKQGKKVLLVAADTFRAAAGEQLQLWASRVGADCVQHQQGADPSAVAFDGMAAAIARGVDVVIVDTAGRLHVKQHLVEELKKIVRTITRQLPGAPHESFLVIDATTGQNAMNQARVFQDALELTGIVLTKLDGTAKGGAVLAIRSELGVPIRYVGLGEGADDLQPFEARTFVDALLGL